MLDTVILTIPKDKFKILRPNRFSLDFDTIELRNGQYLRKWVANPTPAEKKSDKYYPRLTLTKRGLDLTLKIEFSASKLIFNDNINELEEKYFEPVITILNSRLYGWGVVVDKDVLRNADVSAFHASKNIVLTNGYTASLVIKELAKINLTNRLNLTKTKFPNGDALQYYSSSHSFVFYDKIADLTKDSKKAFDKDKTIGQLLLFVEMKKEKVLPEILRMEVRLSLKKKLSSILNKLGYPKNPLFKDIFKKDLCQKIIKLYWQEIILNKNAFLFDMNNKTEKVFGNILDEYPKLKTKQGIYLVGLNLLCKEAGIRVVRRIIKAKRPKTNWATISRDLKLFCSTPFQQNPHGFITDIQNAIDRFDSYKYRSG